MIHPHHSFFLILCFVLSCSLVSARGAFSRQIAHEDRCADGGLIPVTTSHCPSFLSDPRFVAEKFTQCRSLCIEKVPSFLEVTHLNVNCSFCRLQSSTRFTFSDGTHLHYCIPRHKCIKQCGPERQGCIYTGSCASQLCFESRSSAKAAVVVRYTFEGPGTILHVSDDSGTTNTTESTTDESVAVLPHVISLGADYCNQDAANETGYNVSHSCLYSQFPLSYLVDNTTIPSQCRSLCQNFDYSQFEVGRILTGCEFCGGKESLPWLTAVTTTVSHLCIPRAVCIEKCGPEGYGCVYSGSCRSRICFSGIDSKKPAVFSALTDDGSTALVTVDNSGSPVDADPPAFATFDATEGNATQNAPRGQFPITFPPSTSPGENSTLSPDSGPSAKQDAGLSLWMWLGPLIGGVALAAMVAVVVVLIVHRKNSKPGTNGFLVSAGAVLPSPTPSTPDVFGLNNQPTNALITPARSLTTPPIE